MTEAEFYVAEEALTEMLAEYKLGCAERGLDFIDSINDLVAKLEAEGE